MELLGFLIGAFIAVFMLHGAVKATMDAATKGIKLTPPEGIDETRWKNATKIPSEDAGKWLGRVEILIFIMSIWFGFEAIILGWLAFKVATKWEVWQNVIQTPAQLKDESGKDIDALEYLAARRRFASYTFMRFLIGTGGNLLVAAAGVLIGRLLIEFLAGFLA